MLSFKILNWNSILLLELLLKNKANRQTYMGTNPDCSRNNLWAA